MTDGLSCIKIRPLSVCRGGKKVSAQIIVTVLEKLIKLHESLNQLASKKTTIIQEGNTDALTALLIDEQRHVKAITQMEKEREEAVLACMSGGAATIDEVIEVANPEDADRLRGLKEKLLIEVMKLKEQNELNQQLLITSLQFVNLSLDLLRPQDRNYNYDQNNQEPVQKAISTFDSKA